MNKSADSQTDDYRPAAAPNADSLAEDPRVVDLVQEYMAELEKGRSPNLELFVHRYPELSSVVRECLEGLMMVHGGLKSSSHNDSSSTGTLAHGLSERPPNPLGDFQIVRELARGGMGVVYEAIQLSLGRPVALKVLPFAASFDERQLQRFKNEAQAAALLHHTNIVPIYAVGCERGVHFYAMQLIAGQSLAQVIKQLRAEKTPSDVSPPSSPANSHVLSARVPSSSSKSQAELRQSTLAISAAITGRSSPQRDSYYHQVARMMLQAANALEHAHQQGVIHRDIKPANLLINSAGDLWITDFGLAQLQADNGLTRTGDLVGTMRYMSPEQTSGRRTMLDHRTDIYSLGATFYEMLALEPVYNAESRQELLFQILHEEPRPLRSLNKNIPDELETIVLKSLAKNPADRYATAAEFAADIQRYLENQPIQARRPSLLDRLRKWARRHPSAVVAAVMMLVVIAAASLVTNWFVTREQRATETARRNEAQRADEAELRFQQARQAVDLLVKVSEEELAEKPMVQGTRRRLLQTALGYYQDFIEQRKGDAKSQAELAAVQDRVKGILYELEVLRRESQVWLLGQGAVQTDMGLSDEQRSQISDLMRRWTEERMEFEREAEHSNEETKRRRFVEMAEEHERAISLMLSQSQRDRLRQIAIQSQGIFAFKEPEIIAALKISVEQQAAIREIERQAYSRSFGFFGRESGGNSGDRPRPSFPKREEKVAKVLALLSESQVQSWHALVGAPFVGISERGFYPSSGSRRPPQTEKGPEKPSPEKN